MYCIVLYYIIRLIIIHSYMQYTMICYSYYDMILHYIEAALDPALFAPPNSAGVAAEEPFIVAQAVLECNSCYGLL